MEKPSDSTVKGNVENGDIHHDHEVNSQIGCSGFTMFPRFQSTTNKRALGQASRYMNANARKQSEQNIGETRETKSSVSSDNGPDCGSKSLKIEPVDEDGTTVESTALILIDIPEGGLPLVSCELPKEIYLPEFEEKDSEQLRTIHPKEPVRKGKFSHKEYCPYPRWEYFTKDLVFKACRDCHVLNHYSCTRICEFCGFISVGCLKDYIMFIHFGGQDGSTSACMLCNRSGLDPEKLFNHIEGCVLR